MQTEIKKYSRTGQFPLVSIITVCLNSENDIEETILSVINQSYKKIEYIIIDGGSKDSTLEIIRRYKSKIDKIHSAADYGISDAFNKGIKYSRGEIIGILNAGDRYMAETVGLNVLKLINNRDSSFSFGDLTFFSERGPIHTLYGDPDYHKMIHYRMPLINHPTVFVRREIYEKYGAFDTRLKLAMDYEFFRRLHAKNLKGIYLSGIMVEQKMGGISQNKYIRALGEMKEISMQYGLSFSRALFHYFNYILRYTIKISMERFGLKTLVSLIQSKLHVGYKRITT